uniref:Uncharacterized protein n=1 Tax=Junco hyemalis TaxID=40217 RepID=A0A8C5J389_JUNHY
MLPTLKAAFTLLSLLQLVSGTPVTSSHLQQALKEITTRIQALNSEAQVPCNDTRVAQVPFTDPKLPEQELLCQAQVALTKVTMCKKIYEPLISNLKLLHGKKVSRGCCSSPPCAVPHSSAPRCLCPTLGLSRICSLEWGQSWAWQIRQCLG